MNFYFFVVMIMNKPTHIDNDGNAVMVDISGKPSVTRKAVASGSIKLNDNALETVINDSNKKGNVLAVARIAGISAAKKTFDLVPLCHAIPLSSIAVDFEINREESCIDISATVCANWNTGVEMEALTAVSVAALTVFDMCKALDREMIISEIKVREKVKS